MIKRIFKQLIRYLFYVKYHHKFKQLDKSAYIQSLLRLDDLRFISISKNVVIQRYCWIAAVPIQCNESCDLIFGDGTVIGHLNHIYATKSIIFGKNVLTADKVYISDNTHSYHEIDIPIMKQKIIQLKGVKIGDGAWLGENTCIIGASIGRNSVIGANSVVTKDVSAYSVVAGVPAKHIKFRFNQDVINLYKNLSGGIFL